MQKETLKDQFVNTITRGVISGKYPIGKRLPPERALAAEMGISRTVVRSGLAELAAKVYYYPQYKEVGALPENVEIRISAPEFLLNRKQLGWLL